MKIVVLLRRLTAAPGHPAEHLLGACERAALHAAAALRAGRPGSSLAAIAVGPADEDPALLEAAGFGARTLRLWHPALEGTDYDAFARAIAATCRLVGYDLVLAGERSADEGLGVIGAATAEHLGIPHVTGAADLSWHKSGRLVVRRHEGAELRSLAAPPPLLVTVSAAWRGPAPIASSKSAPPLEVLELKQVGLQPEEFRHRKEFEGRLQEREPRRAELLPDAAALADRLRKAGYV